jgi:hypothetical protein
MDGILDRPIGLGDSLEAVALHKEQNAAVSNLTSPGNSLYDIMVFVFDWP